MRYSASFAETLGETRIEFTSNNYSDAFPLLRRLMFRKLPIDLHSQALPLACALLTEQYCGELFEFANVKIGNDYAEAIRTIIGREANVLNVDGLNRNLTSGELDVETDEARRSGPMLAPFDNTPLARIEWSGDFVDPVSRSSNGFVFGSAQTNAGFFANPFRVSIAVGLLFARDRCRNLCVRENGTPLREQNRIREALKIIGVSLKLIT